MGRWFLTISLVFTLLYSIRSLVTSQPSAPTTVREESSRANIGFGQTISDAEVIDLLKHHDAMPRAVFMRSVGGFSGTHRVYDEKDAETVIKEARAKTVETFENSLDGNLVRLQHFAEMYTEEEIAADEDLQNQAYSLLNLRSALEVTLNDAEQGEPLIYSVEVDGPSNRIDLLSRDQKVMAFRSATQNDREGDVPRTEGLNPDQEQYLDPDVQGMSVQEVYQQIKTLGLEAPVMPVTTTELRGGK